MGPLSYYQLYELQHAALTPMRAAADAMKLALRNPFNPFGQSDLGKNWSAGLEVFERITRRYGKPAFGLPTTLVGGTRVAITEKVVWERPFCRLVHFERALERPRNDPKLLIVAPMSGHYATLLRGTVEAMLPKHEVYITDWIDARSVPLVDGRFDLDDYIDYVIEILHTLGEGTHVVAVCQPAVPVLAAVAVMETRGEADLPRTMTLMGGPIDTRVNPTKVNRMAEGKAIDWFRDKTIMQVPFPHAGFLREVYPGFLQLSGFMGMNLDRHVSAHKKYFQHLIEGDGDSQTKHTEFYDEYLAVMDLTAEFYLQTVDTVFIRHALPKGEMMHRDLPVDLTSIRNVALLTVEGENDDISGVGQTEAAQHLCTNIPDDMRAHYMQPKVGHYGVFNGSRFRAEVAPRIGDFILTHNRRRPATVASAPTLAKVEAEPAVSTASPAPVEPAPPVVVVEPVAAKAPAKRSSRKRKADRLDAILLSAPEGVADDLKLISGVGPKLETTLNAIGIFHFWQLAALTDAQLTELDSRLAFKGRAARDKWVEQASALAGETVAAN